MDTTTLIFIVGLAAAWLITVALLLRTVEILRRAERNEPEPAMLLLQSQVEALREQLRTSLDSGRAEVDRRLEETNRVVGDVRRGLGAVGQQVQSVNDVARDLRGLQELLRSPKIRGGMGEMMLAELLGQVLPQAHFRLQHEFSSGERVDAVLRVGNHLVSVDAKFPLENFRRLRDADSAGDPRAVREARRAFRADVRRHVEAIAKRYIRPDEGTFEFAMMYLPAESVYQELLNQDGPDAMDIFQTALSRHVVPVSPQSFYAYLQVIVLGLRGLQIEARAKEILERLGGVQNRLARFTESFDVVVRHLGNAQRQAEEAGRRMGRVEAALADLADDPETRPVAVREPTGEPTP